MALEPADSPACRREQVCKENSAGIADFTPEKVCWKYSYWLCLHCLSHGALHSNLTGIGGRVRVEGMLMARSASLCVCRRERLLHGAEVCFCDVEICEGDRGSACVAHVGGGEAHVPCL